MTDKIIQTNLFGEKVKEKKLNKIEDHWINMPEYNSSDKSKPLKIAIFKFRSEDDFNKFNRIIKKYLFVDDKLHWGSYKSNVKTIWYPPNITPSKYAYIDEKDTELIRDVMNE